MAERLKGGEAERRATDVARGGMNKIDKI